MRERASRWLVAAALLVAGVLIWNRVRIVLWVRLTPWQLLLLFLVVAGVVFVILDLVWGLVRGRR
ncbi:MAG: DUF4175 domain-containing protein [Chloroflexi bacterium]|nr:DUF4175 domain-containing protein [Chloroflexota bacterium]